MPCPSERASARRNLTSRIDRFLRAHVLTDWQADMVATAIEMLKAEQFADGERLMMHVEKAAIFEPVGYVTTTAKDARQLLALLGKAVAA